MGIAPFEVWIERHAELSVLAKNSLWLLALVVFFFVPIYHLVIGAGERPFTGAWFLSQEERQRYKPFVKRMLVWLVAAAAVGAIWSLALNAMGVQQ